jgi:hypothetical protein
LDGDGAFVTLVAGVFGTLAENASPTLVRVLNMKHSMRKAKLKRAFIAQHTQASPSPRMFFHLPFNKNSTT